MTARPSGWYDDPNDETLLRYWDGILWSDRTMPKLRPGLEHVGEARPVEHTDAPARRDGEPRTYPAHWGPEEVGRQQHFQGPNFSGVKPAVAPFGNTLGTVSGLWRRIVAAFVDRFIVSFPITLAFLLFSGDWMNRMQRYVDEVVAATAANEQIPSMPSELLTPPLALSAALVVAMIVYDTLMTTFAGGSTLGKKMLGITTVAAEAPTGPAGLRNRLPIARSALRALIKWAPEALALISVLAQLNLVLQLVIILWALNNARRQGLHDLAAKSEVRRTR